MGEVRHSGCLFVVATPIGNLADISQRAIEVMGSVDLIAAEDTRHSRTLLQALNIRTPLLAYHDFSNDRSAGKILEQLGKGLSIALISDAGTPLISDPGFKLVKKAHAAGFEVLPVPGASAVIAALSVAGLPTDRFVFEGFLPARTAARLKRLHELSTDPRTLVFYESAHRILPSLQDMGTALGVPRQIYIGRELTKKFETHIMGSVADCIARIEADGNQQKGEFVIIVSGCDARQMEARRQRRALDIIEMLRPEVSLKQALAIAAEITGARKNRLYQATLKTDSED